MKKLFLLFALFLIFSLPACKLFDDWDWKTDCELKQCETVSHSTGVCDPGFFNAYCKCEENYFWNWDTRDACVNPCDSKSCKIAHSTGECTSLSYDEYECGCEKGYFWNETELKCVSPCDPNPCGDTNLKECISESKEQFLCICENGYSFDGEKCAELPECSPESATPCKDSATWLAWSSKMSDSWQQKKCGDLSEGGLSDWKSPSVDQLRTLIQNCPNTEPDGECKLVCNDLITCNLENCESCEDSDTGKYSRFGDKEEFWSGTFFTVNCIWTVNFSNAAIDSVCGIEHADDIKSLRCTRCLDGYFWFEGKCVYDPCNSKPCRDIPDAYDNDCYPESETKYRCDCKDDLFWNGEKCVDPCEGVSCDTPNSTKKCVGESWNEYSCECEKNYFWDYDKRKCINMCEDNPCAGIPHANGCLPKNETEYYCYCENGYY